MVETVAIKEQIRKLIDLQKIDAEIYSYRRDLREKPALLEQLKGDFEAKKTALKAQEDKYKSLQLEHKNFELELKSQEDSIAKANAQLSLLKTNKEYTAKLTEIESTKANKSIFEEKILVSFDAIDNAKKNVDQEKAALAEEERKYLAQKKTIEDEVKVLEDKIKVVEGQRGALLEGISKIHLARYERVLNHTDGLAIVPVRNGNCGGCFMNVPAQVESQIKMNKELVFCEKCARILYLEEDM